ncbi:adult cuticle protein 1 [Stomoxys calcitrans]|uniref:adult cuticle protein 1 n=1 Tax=Stomoxys calcitrans TaxID=35570 RepID=UPI0027E39957|nr:adult cuticle protein 1 [Stomoxys calcitrans]
MKFAVAALFTLALALGVQSSVLPLFSHVAGGGLSYTAVSSPVVASPWAPWGHAVVAAGPHPAVAVHAPALAVHGSSVAVHAAAAPVHPAPSVAVHAAAAPVHPAPSVAVHAAAAPVVHAPVAAAVHAPVVVPAFHGSYVAKTRGAVHTAPLAGHLNSVANVNLAPAPGTH